MAAARVVAVLAPLAAACRDAHIAGQQPAHSPGTHDSGKDIGGHGICIAQAIADDGGKRQWGLACSACRYCSVARLAALADSGGSGVRCQGCGLRVCVAAMVQ